MWFDMKRGNFIYWSPDLKENVFTRCKQFLI